MMFLVSAAARCTGGSESNAAVEPTAQTVSEVTHSNVDARRELADISAAIPVYQGAKYRGDLTDRDAVMIRSRYGTRARVLTMATNDSFPQVYHYYTTYLAQFRAFPSQNPWPSGHQNWRTLEIPLKDVMQDPFIPGEAFDPAGPQILLQIAETEAEPRTVIRYIITPGVPATAAPAAPLMSAASDPNAATVAR